VIRLGPGRGTTRIVAHLDDYDASTSLTSNLRISVAMTTFNGERFLGEQLDSLARQELLPDELQIGDDGSTDRTLEILQEFARTAPFPVHVHRNERNLGYGENFIQTALRCSSEWIAFCDQDDVWLPAKLARCAEAIASGPEDLTLVAHDVIVAGEDLSPRRLFYSYPRRRPLPRLTLEPEWFCLGFTQLFDRRLLTQIPPAPRIDIGWHREKQSHDVWIALLANATGSVTLLDEPLAYYRSHGGNVTLSEGTRTLRQRIAAPFRNNGSLYEARALYLEEAARVLRAKAEQASDGELSVRLADASRQIAAQARRLADRSAAYRSGRLGGRLAAYRRLRRSHAYKSGSRWAFGPASAVKDLLHALSPL
jgi:glycosyltransferase involved in cell wall biosynthesis